MRKFLTSCIDCKTNKEMVYSDCSFNEGMFELEKDLEKHGEKVIDCILDTVIDTIITTVGKFYYDEERRCVLRDRR
jgi:hypothetical protein